MEMELESIMLPGIDPQRPIVIAGPCSAETEEQVMETARGIADKGIKVFFPYTTLFRSDSKELVQKACNG